MGTYGRGGGSRSPRSFEEEEEDGSRQVSEGGAYGRHDPIDRAMQRVQANSQKIMTRAKEMQQLRMMREAKHVDYSMKQLKEIAERENNLFKSRVQDVRSRHMDDISLMKERHRQELQQLEQDFKEQVKASRRNAHFIACDLQLTVLPAGAAAGERARNVAFVSAGPRPSASVWRQRR
jgi:DNA-binding transcriptional MerR regulator